MKIKVFIVGLICVLLISCDYLFSPDNENNGSNETGVASMALDGSLAESTTAQGNPKFSGFVKNTGERTVYNVKVEITMFSDAARTNQIDKAETFVANKGDIAPGERAAFEIVSQNVSSHDLIKGTTTKITWLNRN